MADQTSNITRRRVLQASGTTLIASTVLTSAATAETRLISGVPDTIELEDCDSGTDTFTVQIEGPPFGRTDVEVTGDGVDVGPSSFQLSGRGDSETVTVGPGDGTVTVAATTPRGDSQTETIDVTCLGDPEFNWSIQNEDLIEIPAGTGRPDNQIIEVFVENVGEGPGEKVFTIDNNSDETWMGTWGYRGETEKTVELGAGEATTIEFELNWNRADAPDGDYGWDVIVEGNGESDSIRIEMDQWW